MTASASQTWIAQIASTADEQYDLSAEDLGRLFAQAHVGLIIDALADPDAARYRADALFLVDRLVELARPRPRAAGVPPDQFSGTRQLSTEPPAGPLTIVHEPP
jgi:hypothetical protein